MWKVTVFSLEWVEIWRQSLWYMTVLWQKNREFLGWWSSLTIYSVSIKSFPVYKHLLQANYVECKRSTCWSVLMCCKKTSWVIFWKKKYVCIPRSFLVISVCNQGKNLCWPCISLEPAGINSCFARLSLIGSFVWSWGGKLRYLFHNCHLYFLVVIVLERTGGQERRTAASMFAIN